MIAKMRGVVTRRTSELSDVGSHFQAVRPAPGRTASLVFNPRCADSSVGGSAAELSYNSQVAKLFCVAPSQWLEQPVLCNQSGCRTIFPERLRAHLDAHAAGMRPHCAVPMGTRTVFRTIHDLPMPIIIEVAPHRCLTCFSFLEPSYYSVTDDDVRAAFPDVLMTRMFLL